VQHGMASDCVPHQITDLAAQHGIAVPPASALPVQPPEGEAKGSLEGEAKGTFPGGAPSSS